MQCWMRILIKHKVYGISISQYCFHQSHFWFCRPCWFLQRSLVAHRQLQIESPANFVDDAGHLQTLQASFLGTSVFCFPIVSIQTKNNSEKRSRITTFGSTVQVLTVPAIVVLNTAQPTASAPERNLVQFPTSPGLSEAWCTSCLNVWWRKQYTFDTARNWEKLTKHEETLRPVVPTGPTGSTGSTELWGHLEV